MKRLGMLALAVSLFVVELPARAAATEEWKGEPDQNQIRVGALVGLGVIDSSAGFSMLGTASKKIVTRGFAPEVNNSVWIEVQMGPLFVSGASAFAYSTHLRWDFHKNADWTFYSLGGVAGHITGESLGNRFLLFPRLGLGLMQELGSNVALRAEISHEFITAGVSWAF